MAEPVHFDKVRQLIVRAGTGVKEGDVGADSNLQDHIGLDSLDTIELMMSVEKEYDIELPDTVVDGIQTVRDLCNAIEDAVKSKQG